MGIDVTFLTGIYYKPERFPYSLARWAPRTKRKALIELLELRRIEGLSPNNVVTILGPSLELAYRTGILSLRRWWNLWDALAAGWIKVRYPPATQTRRTVIHCFIECGLRTLRTAGAKGMTRVLEVTLPPLLAEPAQMAEWGVSERDFPTDISLLKRELSEADYVLVQSEFGVRTVEALGISSSRIFQINLGLDTEKFFPRTAEREPGPLRVVFVGQINRRKGVHHLLQAWRELGLNNAVLLLAGNTQSAPPELLKEVDEAPNCRPVGHLRGQDLLTFYQQADILVHPSFAEGGCAAIYEGLGCGVPCVVSSNSTSAVRSGIEGFVFPVGDIASMKSAIYRLSADPNLRRTMGEAARERAVTSLSMEAFAQEIAAVYRDIAEHKDSNCRGRAAQAF